VAGEFNPLTTLLLLCLRELQNLTYCEASFRGMPVWSVLLQTRIYNSVTLSKKQISVIKNALNGFVANDTWRWSWRIWKVPEILHTYSFVKNFGKLANNHAGIQNCFFLNAALKRSRNNTLFLAGGEGGAVSGVIFKTIIIETAILR
jgi:hypothetical protein